MEESNPPASATNPPSDPPLLHHYTLGESEIERQATLLDAIDMIDMPPSLPLSVSLTLSLPLPPHPTNTVPSRTTAVARTCDIDARPLAESRCHGCAANEAYVPYYEDQKKKPREASTVCFA